MRFTISGALHDTSVLVRQTAVKALGDFVSLQGCPSCSEGRGEDLSEAVELSFMATLARLQHPQEPLGG